jgi:colanic acid/amylovoran biosynthesis protein
MIISAAGNFLYTSGTLGIPFLLSLFTVYYGQLARKPTYTLPQTLGPIRRRHERLLARLVLSRMRLVMLRDAISAEVWQAWKVPRAKAILIPDLAFAHPGRQHKREALALLEAGGLEDDSRPKLGVTLIHWGAQSRSFARQIEYEKAFQAMTRQFITSYGGQVIVFSQVRGPTESEDDIVPARRLLAGLEDCSDSIILMDRPVPPQVLRAAYGQMDLLVGTRLHSSIFALTEGVPVVAIGYQYKTRGIMRMLGLERWVLEIEQVSADTLSRLLRDAWSEREQTRSHLQRLLPRIREQASQAGAHIAADFRGQSRAEARGPE